MYVSIIETILLIIVSCAAGYLAAWIVTKLGG